MNHDKGWSKEDEEAVPDHDAYTPGPEVTVKSVRDEAMAGIGQLCVFAGAHKLEGNEEAAKGFTNEYWGLLKFALNAGLISKLEFNQFQAMRRRATS